MFDDKRLLLNPDYAPEQLLISTANCSWTPSEPSFTTYTIYAFVVPVLATFGFCANFMNAIVFMRPKMSPSAFSYLAALSWLDCFSCLLITFTALSRSIFYGNIFWMTYDFQWQIPLFGISTGAANLVLAALSCDRWFYLRYGIANGCGQPQFCRRKVARRIIVGILVVSVLLNIPYFFVFVVNSDVTFSVREFYVTTYYRIYNWMSFILLTLLPAMFLIIGHIAIIIAFRRWTNQSRLCRKYGQCNAKTTQKRYQHQIKLTITIIILIVLYIVGEMPAALTSRKSSLNLLFGGDIKRVNFYVMARIEMICLTLNALQLSLNILVYALINPSFMPELFICLTGVSNFCCSRLCLSAWLNCARCTKKKAKQTDEKAENNECADARIRCEEDNDNANSNWDTDPEDKSCEVECDFDNRNCSMSIITPKIDQNQAKCSQVWNMGVTWQRSSSFGLYICDNLALEVNGTCVKITHNGGDQHRVVDEKLQDISAISKKQVKRHSLAY